MDSLQYNEVGEDFATYIQRLEQYFYVHATKDTDGCFLTLVCKTTFVVLKSFPQEPDELEYKDVKKILKKHFEPILNFF